MLLWTTSVKPPPSLMNKVPTEAQDQTLLHATSSSILAAELGCELGSGSPFSWFAGDMKVGLEDEEAD